MAIYTQLIPTATPGRRYSFVAKGLAVGEKGAGPFTALSVLGTPGSIHSFVAKAAAVGGVKGEGLFTQLSVLGTPGRRYIFLPKSIVVPIPEEPERIFDAGGGGGVHGKVQEDLYRWRLREEMEIIDIIIGIVLSGRL